MISAALSLLEAVVATSGPVYRGIDRNLRVDIPRIEVAIEIDGELSKPVWEQAARLTGSRLHRTRDGFFLSAVMYFGCDPVFSQEDRRSGTHRLIGVFRRLEHQSYGVRSAADRAAIAR